jgi:hypothetical protein
VKKEQKARKTARKMAKRTRCRLVTPPRRVAIDGKLGVRDPILPSIATLLGGVTSLHLVLFAIFRAVL